MMDLSRGVEVTIAHSEMAGRAIEVPGITKQ